MFLKRDKLIHDSWTQKKISNALYLHIAFSNFDTHAWILLVAKFLQAKWEWVVSNHHTIKADGLRESPRLAISLNMCTKSVVTEPFTFYIECILKAFTLMYRLCHLEVAFLTLDQWLAIYERLIFRFFTHDLLHSSYTELHRHRIYLMHNHNLFYLYFLLVIQPA